MPHHGPPREWLIQSSTIAENIHDIQAHMTRMGVAPFTWLGYYGNLESSSGLQNSVLQWKHHELFALIRSLANLHPFNWFLILKCATSAAPFLLLPLSSPTWRLLVLLPPHLLEHCCRMSPICSRTIFIPSFSCSNISPGLHSHVQNLSSGTRSCLNLPWFHLCSPDLIISKQKHLFSSLCFSHTSLLPKISSSLFLTSIYTSQIFSRWALIPCLSIKSIIHILVCNAIFFSDLQHMLI